MNPDEVEDHYEGSDVPGEFRRLTAELGCEQLSVTLIRVPPNSDGTLTMRFGDEIRTVRAPAAVSVAPSTPRSHRNEGPEPVEMWAISRKLAHADATKIDDFWEASADAKQRRG